MIPLSVPYISGNEWKYIKECLDTEWVSSAGKYVDKFEENICHFTGAKYAVACVNGTAALQVALRLVGVQPGDEVIVPTVTFIAPINVVRYNNAEPVFMDCDEFYNIDVTKTSEFIENETVFKNGYTYNKRTNARISAIIPVHVFGNAVDLEPLIDICSKRNIRTVEDATESVGTYYISGKLTNRHTGTIGDIGCYSFNGNKIITTGGGGMIVTDNPEYAEKARYLTTQAKDDPKLFIHNEIGYNYRLNNVQGAMGIAQLERIDEFIDIKRNNYTVYKNNINKMLGLNVADTPPYALNNCWMYALQVSKEKYYRDINSLMNYLAENCVETRILWYLNHLQKPYKDCQSYRIEMAYNMIGKTLNIPCSISLNKKDIVKVINLLKYAP